MDEFVDITLGYKEIGRLVLTPDRPMMGIEDDLRARTETAQRIVDRARPGQRIANLGAAQGVEIVQGARDQLGAAPGLEIREEDENFRLMKISSFPIRCFEKLCQ